MEGSRYKQEHKVAFPPFHFFTQLAKARNDLSFNLLSVSNTVNRSRFVESHGKGQRSLSVHKTEVFPSSNSTSSVEGPDKFCPVHHKPHPLRRCRGFRERPIDKRKKILKEHNICFKCCASDKHVARSCESTARYFECGSDRHPTALHPGPVPWASKPSTSPAEHGGEKEVQKSAVVSNCTEVCGEGFHGKSCSKICLVTVYPTGDRSSLTCSK